MNQYSQTIRFINALFEPDDIVELRLLHPGGRVDRLYVPAASVPEHLQELKKSNDAGAHVYFGAHPRDGEDGTAAGISKARVLFADFDNVAEESAVRAKLEVAGLPEPTAVVSTGGGFHCWWRLDSELTREQWEPYERGVVAHSGADPAVKDWARIMRLPGFVNTKPGRGQEARVVDFTGLTYPTPKGYFPSAKVTDRIPRPLGVDIPDDILLQPYGWSGRELLEMGRWPVTKDNQNRPRRETIFEIACDLAARGWDFRQASEVIMAAARKLPPEVSQLTTKELADLPRQIANAFKQSREPELWDREKEGYESWKREAKKHIDRAQAEELEQAAPPDESDIETARKLISFGEAFKVWHEGEEVEFLSTGIEHLDNLLGGGIAKSELCGLGGIPGCGKSALAMQIAVSIASSGERVLWMFGEMTIPRLFARAVTVWWHKNRMNASPIDVSKFTKRRDDSEVHGAAALAAQALFDSLHFLDGDETLEELDAACGQLQPGLVIIDYLQLMNPTVSVRGSSQNERLTEVSRTLRKLAKKHRLAVLVVMSSSKGIGGDPDIGDICRGSGQVDYDVDSLIFGAREKAKDPDPNARPTTWRVKKSRNGSEGEVYGVFLGRYQTFVPETVTTEQSAPEPAFFPGSFDDILRKQQISEEVAEQVRRSSRNGKGRFTQKEVADDDAG